jgi:hypothetical protein
MITRIPLDNHLQFILLLVSSLIALFSIDKSNLFIAQLITALVFLLFKLISTIQNTTKYEKILKYILIAEIIITTIISFDLLFKGFMNLAITIDLINLVKLALLTKALSVEVGFKVAKINKEENQ